MAHYENSQIKLTVSAAERARIAAKIKIRFILTVSSVHGGYHQTASSYIISDLQWKIHIGVIEAHSPLNL